MRLDVFYISWGLIRINISTCGFLASAFGASDILTTIFLETFEDVPFEKRLRNGLI